MIDIQSTLTQLASLFSAYPLPLSLLLPIVGGEGAVLVLAFFAGQGVLPLVTVLVGSYVGMLLLDVFWFFVPRHPWAVSYIGRIRITNRYRQLETRLETVFHGNDILILLVSKVLLGTRILVLAYLSSRTLRFSTFLAYDALATLIWTVFLGLVGWLAGRGLYTLSDASHSLTFAALSGLVLAALVYAFVRYLHTWTHA